ncbi:pyridoxamine 5'-phosphate oxidase family protein [Nocardia brasiliensis]|uniref:pyridoxamine 5'-phosphate oxidase family protein n=1 Tax=Nocardia brasiliensis TaxID=37326 RepID=UPI002455B276|nr:pyridoxamine 5'-phosphate oxidase family protein [Nocardia brasiliensis]
MAELVRTSDLVQELTVAECWDKLDETQLGRIVVNTSGELDIFPVNYAVDSGKIYFRTAPGSKLLKLTINSSVLFEADQILPEAQLAWSVVIRGHAEQISIARDVHHADTLAIRPWISTPKYEYVRIDTHAITGRQFRLNDEVTR